ncbi:putative toxin-antitoxin system toxin component, PIN family [Cognatilysobacter lacus]|uniref:Putative toxin-antitoxin system toxin component, PIN family n=1 Tax=Cognatilysobacter lacus TaxID=1643323 RepID=A0A5D8Z9T9_9GAMM|nr:putative toxin-antitoxin system toxin component, PIN family [Lysobacter lacus]TZF91571.1 putative toxin-antitoxin system toxin component, PIN family [Lysobacter lacus]
MEAPPTLVLDTNAWLDLLVFRDPLLDGLAGAVDDATLRLATDPRALAELARVLRYDALRLDEVCAAAHLAEAVRLAHTIDVPSMQLPRCPDADDQMFLEIAVAARATALVTRDAALLGMSRRMGRDYGFAIIEPAGWRSALAPDVR